MEPSSIPRTHPRQVWPRVGTSNTSHAVPAGQYWRHGWMVCVALYGLMAARLADTLPGAARLHPVLVGGPVLVGLLLVNTGRRAREAAMRDVQVRLAAAYVMWAAVTVPFALWPGAAFSAVPALLMALVLMGVFLLCEPTERALDRTLSGVVIGTVIMCALVLSVGAMKGGRLSTQGSLDPNDFAGLLAVTLPVAAMCAVRSRGWRRILYAVGAVIFVFAIMRTASRGGTIALVVGILALIASQRPGRLAVGVVVAVIGAGLAWQYGPPEFRDRMRSLGDVENDYNVTEPTGRMGTWTRGLEYGLEFPITGLGPNNFPLAEGESLREMKVAGAWHTAHNTYVQVFAEMGLPGAVLLLGMIGVALRRAARLWSRRRRAGNASPRLHRPEVLAALLAFCASAVFLSHAYSYLLFGILGLSGLAGRVAEAQTTHPSAGLRPRVRSRGGLGRGVPATGPSRHVERAPDTSGG